MISIKMLAAVRRLIHRMDDEAYRNAQGDNAHDVRMRYERYAKKLSALLRRSKPE